MLKDAFIILQEMFATLRKSTKYANFWLGAQFFRKSPFAISVSVVLLQEHVTSEETTTWLYLLTHSFWFITPHIHHGQLGRFQSPTQWYNLLRFLPFCCDFCGKEERKITNIEMWSISSLRYQYYIIHSTQTNMNIKSIMNAKEASLFSIRFLLFYCDDDKKTSCLLVIREKP